MASLSPERVLVIRLGALGDVVNVAPAVSALRAARPHAHITWLVEDRASEAVDLLSDVDEKLVFPRRAWQQGLWRPIRLLHTLRETFRLLRRLSSPRFDVSLDFQGNLKSGVFGLLAGARQRVGYAKGFCREGNHIFTNVHFAPHSGQVRRCDRHMALLRHFGLDVQAELPTSRVPASAQDAVRDFLSERQRPGQPLVAMHPGASKFAAFKRWPAEKYARLADQLAQDPGCLVVFTYGPGERGTVDDILREMKMPAALLPTSPSIATMAAMFQASALVVGGDTGPLHLAAGLGRPVVGIYGPKDTGLYAPCGDSYVLVRSGLPCSPCTRRRCAGSACMRSIRVATVLDSCRSLLAHPRVRAAAPAEVVVDKPGPAPGAAAAGDAPPYRLWPLPRGDWTVQAGPLRGRVTPYGLDHELLVRLSDPAGFFDQPDAEVIEEGPGVRTCRVPMDFESGRQAICVRHDRAAPKRARAEYTSALVVGGTPERPDTPLAFVERRRFGRCCESMLVTTEQPRIQ